MNIRRLLVVLYYYKPYMSGLSEYARRLSEAFVKSGMEVTVLTTRFEADVPAEETIKGVKVVRVPILLRLGKGVVSPAFTRAAVSLAREHDLAQLHLPLPDAGLIAPFVPRENLLITYHCDIYLGRGLIDRAIEKASYFLMDIAMRRGAAIVGNSQEYFAHSRFAGYSDRFHEIFPPIDTDDFSPRRDPHFWQRLSIPGEGVKIGFVGRVVYEKGLHYLLQAIPRLLQQVSTLQIVIAGDDQVAGGGIRRELDEYQARHPGIIHFTGRLSHDDLVTFYSEIDVLVLPSFDPLESFGMVQIEAMCCGTPVVASDMPGVDQAIKKTGFGRLSRPKDPADLSDQILRVLAGDFDQHGFCAADWDTSQTVARYKDLFRELETSGARTDQR